MNTIKVPPFIPCFGQLYSFFQQYLLDYLTRIPIPSNVDDDVDRFRSDGTILLHFNAYVHTHTVDLLDQPFLKKILLFTKIPGFGRPEYFTFAATFVR